MLTMRLVIVASALDRDRVTHEVLVQCHLLILSFYLDCSQSNVKFESWNKSLGIGVHSFELSLES